MENRNASESRPDGESVVRFKLRERIEHIVLMVIFVALAVTGIIQKYYSFEISQWIILQLGGIESTRLIHRVFGVVFTGTIIYHFVYLNFGLIRKRMKFSMVPNLQDFRDVVSELKRGLGFKAPKPQFGRFDYRQKFEYLGLIFGSVILIITGYMLIFPVITASLFSGQVVATALVFHGYEATLAVIVIIVWHLYDVIFKPGIFPADTSIFTGRISKKRMLAEHYLEYVKMTEVKNVAPEATVQEVIRPEFETEPVQSKDGDQIILVDG